MVKHPTLLLTFITAVVIAAILLIPIPLQIPIFCPVGG